MTASNIYFTFVVPHWGVCRGITTAPFVPVVLCSYFHHDNLSCIVSAHSVLTLNYPGRLWVIPPFTQVSVFIYFLQWIIEQFGLKGTFEGLLVQCCWGWWNPGTGCPERALMPHPWKHSRSGWMRLWATWSDWRCPCSFQAGWTRWPLKVPSNPTHSMILWPFLYCFWSFNAHTGPSWKIVVSSSLHPGLCAYMFIFIINGRSLRITTWRRAQSLVCISVPLFGYNKIWMRRDSSPCPRTGTNLCRYNHSAFVFSVPDAAPTLPCWAQLQY